MCGINGLLYLSKDFKRQISNDIKVMNEAIIHRGPDDSGIFEFQNEDYSCAMSMRRLSIIDLNSGTQPIYSKDKNIVIVFNGEIYNYKLLRKNLEDIGIVFQTNSDTEVILQLYIQDGPSSFAKLDGMFAFSLFDKNKNKLYIARDFFGEKPLYYTFSENRFIWSSELKSIRSILPKIPKISKEGLSIFFQLTFIPSPFTIFEGVFKLEANKYIEIDCIDAGHCIHEIVRDKMFFDFKSKKDAIILTNNLVNESVSSRSISDVPIGTFLSGGVDSSIISFCLSKQQNSKIDTFSIGFNKKSFDESEKSKVVAKLINSNHHEFIISEKDLSIKLDEIILNFDEPFADSSALATYIVSNKTRDFVKVALTGDGGDEIFGGYNKYYMGSLNKAYTKLIPYKLHEYNVMFFEKFLKSNEDNRGIKFKMNRFLKSVDYGNSFFFKIIKLGFQDDELKKILNKFNDNEPLDYFKLKAGNINNSLFSYRNIDRIISLEGDLLVKVDRTSMLASLECRAPFLNKNLWDFSSQLPDNYLINGWDKKHILKKAFENYFPNKFLEHPKKGFGVPVGDWLKSSLRMELLSYIDVNFLTKQNIFNIYEITNLVNLHLSGSNDNSFKVWSFFVFQKWYISTYEKEIN